MKVYIVIDQGGRSWGVRQFLRRLYHRLRYGTWETVPWGGGRSARCSLGPRCQGHYPDRP